MFVKIFTQIYNFGVKGVSEISFLFCVIQSSCHINAQTDFRLPDLVQNLRNVFSFGAETMFQILSHQCVSFQSNRVHKRTDKLPVDGFDPKVETCRPKFILLALCLFVLLFLMLFSVSDPPETDKSTWRFIISESKSILVQTIFESNPRGCLSRNQNRCPAADKINFSFLLVSVHLAN